MSFFPSALFRLNVKNVIHDDVLAANWVPPQLLGMMSNNTGGLEAVRFTDYVLPSLRPEVNLE